MPCPNREGNGYPVAVLRPFGLNRTLLGFPFDVISVSFDADLHSIELDSSGVVVSEKPYTGQFLFQRAFPGRIIRYDVGMWLPFNMSATMSLVRSIDEKALVLGCGFAFLLLTSVITAKLFGKGVELNGLQEITAVAGYLLAAAGFRDLLGVPRATGTSAFEVVVLGVPLTVLALAIAVSTWRSAIKRKEL